MTPPAANSLGDQDDRPGLRQRLIARRVQVMGGRISEYAAGQQLRSLGCRLVAYMGVLLLTAAAVTCSLLNQGPAAFGCVAAGITWGIAWNVAAYRHGRAACLDIVRAAGLPDHAWRKVRANTPQRFDAWLTRAQPATEALSQ